MALQPVRFVGHKIGPFEQIELNWTAGSRHTLIIGENGMGKTTLTVALAACLASHLTKPPTISRLQQAFNRFAQDKTAYAFFKLSNTARTTGALCVHSDCDPNYKNEIWHHINERPEENMLHLWQSLFVGPRSGGVTNLTATYGVGRDIPAVNISNYQELGQVSLNKVLDPFSPIPAEEIFQWIANQFYNRALAIADNQAVEAQNYKDAIERLQSFIANTLGYPIQFDLLRNPNRLVVRQNGAVLENFQQLSDGLRHFLSWTLDYLVTASRLQWANETAATTTPGLVVVDEIDSHLHPEWQRRILPAISRLLPETHIIATTHSPFVVGSADDAQIFQIYKDAETNQLKVRASYDEMYGLPADLVLRKAFLDSLYTPEIEGELQEFSDLADKLAGGLLDAKQQERHQELFEKLAKVNPWIENLLYLSQMKGA